MLIRVSFQFFDYLFAWVHRSTFVLACACAPRRARLRALLVR
nr:MAG TPA: hypothetical protein [Caudoviricetes sp.]